MLFIHGSEDVILTRNNPASVPCMVAPVGRLAPLTQVVGLQIPVLRQSGCYNLHCDLPLTAIYC